MIVAYYQRCDSRSLSIISRDESEFKESRYIYTIYSTRNRASGFVITDRRQEGGGSYSHVRAYEKLQPFHHLHVKFNAIRAILLRSDAFSLNAIRYPLSLSLSFSFVNYSRSRLSSANFLPALVVKIYNGASLSVYLAPFSSWLATCPKLSRDLL